MSIRPILRAGALFFLLPACSSLQQVQAESAESAGIGNAIVIEEEGLVSTRGSVLTIMQSHVRSMRVSRNDVCPHIVLRGGGGRSQAAEAVVYIDAQRMSDTCVLDTLDVESIGRVEVYPGGVTQRAGYSSNSGGLILVFMKNGSNARLW